MEDDDPVTYPIIDALAGHLVMLDGQLVPAADPAIGFLFQPTAARMVYEVIRIVRGVPLFWEDHVNRLVCSVGGAISIPDSLYDESLSLIQANGLGEANLRLVLSTERRVLHLTPSYYPDDAQISRGVDTGLLAWERRDPNIKVIHADYKAAVAARFAQPGPFGPCFELLLADRAGYLTEGSRANLFFIRGRDVISAPDQRILIGITRRHVTRSIEAAGLNLVTGLLRLEDVRSQSIDAAFLSGSPIDLLPIRSIEDLVLPSADNDAFIRLYNAYMALVDAYIRAHPVPFTLAGTRPSDGYGRL
jgi:branched-chain amino acid aminotransferase